MDAVEEIKSRLSVEDVVSEYVQLKRAGRNWKGLSPFTSEKTPSFTVSPEKQIWHDFSSGKGGDMFSFVMAMEGLDFKGALELLARKAGIDLDQYRSKSGTRGPDKEKLYELNELSTKFYQTQFSKSQTALSYALQKRQFSKATALEWRLGYAPNTGKALVDFLKSRGYAESDIRLAGLTNRFGGDLFRGRLMIPLSDAQGRVVGFTARMLADEPNAPKYLNTPGTPLYDKSRHVFGLHLAKEAIRKTGYSVLAEGNLDVIMSHQAGVKQVVATAGTALTEHHLKALARFSGDIRLCFDADKAGLAATERAIPIASKTKVSLGIVTIPSGKDPDELIKQNPATWQEIIEQPQYALDWLMVRYEQLLDISTATGKRQFSDVLLPVVRSLNDPVEQDHYLAAMAEKLESSKDALQAKMAQAASAAAPARQRRHVAVELPPSAVLERRKQQDHFLALLLLRPELRSYLELLTPDMFGGDEQRALLEFLLNHPDFKGKKDELKKLAQTSKTLHSSAMQGASEERPEPYKSTVRTYRSSATPQRAETDDSAASSAGWQVVGVQSLGEYVKILGLQHDELYQGLELTELRYEAARLKARLVEAYVKDQKQNIRTELQTADEAAAQVLLGKAKELDELLRRVTMD